MSSIIEREARRRRILQKSEDRLALITGRKPNRLSQSIDNHNNSDESPPLIPQDQQFNHDLRSFLPSDHQPSVSRTEEDKPTHFKYDQASNFNEDDTLVSAQTKEETIPFLIEPQQVTKPSRSSTSKDKIEGQDSSVFHKVLEATLAVINRTPIKNINSQQVGVAVRETEFDRLLCALTMAILVVLSSSGFWILGTDFFRGILLFRPLFLVLITNITLIIRKLHPGNKRKSIHGNKDDNQLVLGVGYAWAEEAGRALELGLMLQNLMGVLFMDCSVYATIVVFGLSLFG